MFQPRLNEDNTDPRCACVLLLDTSGSMDGEPINELNKGLQTFAGDIKEDPLARKRIEIAVITVGGVVTTLAPFQEGQSFNAPILTAGGGTPMGAGILSALTEIQKQKDAYKTSGLEYYRPWLVIMTDGAPTDGPTCQQAVNELRRVQDRKGLVVMPVGVGPNADMSFLNTLSADRPAAPMNSIQSFAAFFKWLSASMSQVSLSAAKASGEEGLAEVSQVALPSPEGWMRA